MSILTIFIIIIGFSYLTYLIIDIYFLKPKSKECEPDVVVPNAKKYEKDDDDNCIVSSCNTGYTKNDNNKCIYDKTGESCESNLTDENGLFVYGPTGICKLQCNTGYEKKGDKCEFINKNTSCESSIDNPIPNAVYMYTTLGKDAKMIL